VAAAVALVVVNRPAPHSAQVLTGNPSKATSAASAGATTLPTAGGATPLPSVSTTTLPPTTLTVPPPKPVPVPAGFSPVSVTWVSTKTGWVLGVVPGGGLVLAHTTDGGTTWAQAPALPAALTYFNPFGPTPHKGGVDRVRFGDLSDGWLFGPELWATHDGGNSWHKMTGLAASDVQRLEAASGTVYAVVQPSDGGAQILTSPVGRDDWTALTGSSVDPDARLALAGASAYADSSTVLYVQALTPPTVSIVGHPCAAVNPGALTVISGLATTADIVSAVCGYNQAAGSQTKVVVVSRDGGRTWSTVGTAPVGGIAMYLAVAPNGTYVISAAGGDSVLYRSIDGGVTWTTVYTDTADGGAPIAELGFTDDNRGVAIVQVPNGQNHMLVTVDGGATWTTAKF
jgi:photosystem II stability/assembly factor-like uncharacterized protein